MSTIKHRTIMKMWITILLAACTVIWSPVAFGDEIQDAVKSGDLAKVEALLKDHPDLVSSKDNTGKSLLHYAAFYGYTNIAGFLLTKKANVNAKDDGGGTPLQCAAKMGHTDVVELLLANKAEVDPKVESNGYTPLHFAAEMGNKDVVGLLLANKAEVNAKDKKGETPLHLAKTYRHDDVAELLSQHGGQE
jgi:ankyrin repeat protein